MGRHPVSGTLRFSLGIEWCQLSVPRKSVVVGQVADVEGFRWDVCDVRPTKYGFALLYGVREDDHPGGRHHLIATDELYRFWDANRTKSHGFLFDLPGGRTTLKRMRKRLGFHFHNDSWNFWLDRTAELEALSAREFAAKYEVSFDMVSEWRLKVLGRTAREPNWWRKKKVLKVLLSGITLREVGMKLDISISQAKRLRDRLKQEPG